MKLQLHTLLFIGVLLLISSMVFGQGLCNVGGGNFEIAPTEGCAPLTVKITNNVTNTITVGYQPFYDGVSQNPAYANFSYYTYASAGNFRILQYGAISSGVFSMCKQVRVYETNLISAQYSSCGGGKIKVVLTDNSVLKVYDQLEIKWGDGQTETWQKGSGLNLEHTYTTTTSGPTITIKGVYTSNSACLGGRTLSIPVSFQQQQLGNISIQNVEMRGDGSIRVTYNGITAIPTSIQYSSDGNSYTTAGSRSSGGLQPFDIQGLNKGQTYKLRLSSEDLCASTLTTKPITSMVLTGKSEDGKNILSWNKYDNPDGFVEYDLMKDGTVVKTFTSINDVTYTDEDVECGSFSEYQLVAKINGITSTSAPVGLKAEIASVKQIEKAFVSVLGDNNVVISANVPGAGPNSTYDLSMERAESGSTTYKKIITLYNQNQYSDVDVKTNEKSYCYRLTYQNSCGQKAPATEPICTIFLQRQLANMSWTPEKPVLPNIVSYDVLQNGSSGSKDEVDVKLQTSYTPSLNAKSDLEYTFQIRANSNDPDFESYSNIISVSRNANVYIPDAFSPNGDGTNDVLEAKAALLQSFSLSVFNRWGHIVFHSDDIAKSWDGTINGVNAPVGSYVYKLKVVDIINQAVEKKGTFMLFR